MEEAENLVHCTHMDLCILHLRYTNMAFVTHLADGGTFDLASAELISPVLVVLLSSHLVLLVNYVIKYAYMF